MPNIALINELKERYPDPSQLKIIYFGTRKGMERDLIPPLGAIYRGIFCGKLRRYFSWHNFTDFFKLPAGIVQSLVALAGFRPQVIFCKGGYVCFPVAVAGWILRIPVVLHESDVMPGLANKLSARFASKICVSFEETKQFFPRRKTILTGNPVRRELVFGNAEDGRAFTSLNENLPVILFMGGSQGADFINEIVWKNFSRLLRHHQVVHICGEGKVKSACDLVKLLPEKEQNHLTRYRAFSFVGREMKDLYAFADLSVCRSGAITLAEVAFFGKPAILIPLSSKASRGDQSDNALVYARSHPARVIEEDDFEADAFFGAITSLLERPLRSVGPQRSDHRVADHSFSANEKIISLLLKEYGHNTPITT